MMETKKMAMEIRKLSLLLIVLLSILSILIFPHNIKQITMGILVGGLSGIMGFNMICNMVNNIDGDTLDVKSRAIRSYTRRYLIYAIIFALSASAGMNVFALLSGILTNKVSILLYSFIHRKEDE